MSKGVRTLCGWSLSALLIFAFPLVPRAGAQGADGSQAGRPDATAGPAGQEESFVPGRLLVKFRDGVSEGRAEEIVAAHGARSADVIAQIGVRLLELPEGAERAVQQALAARPEVEFADLDHVVPAESVVPNDTYYSSQWHLPKIQSPSAWDITTGSSAVTIAILDTGVDGTHPDLAPKMVPGWNFYDNNSDTSDVYGHGTEVAGTAAAISNNGSGVASPAWGCQIMPVRISDVNGYGYSSTISNGLTWAADHGARVANISYRMSTDSAVTSAAKYFQSKGGVVTISAGNQSTFDASADNPYVLTVAATDSTDTLASFSNTGNLIDLAAPGVGIYTTARGGGYSSATGTSFSAPVVAGVAALVISANPGLTATEVQDALTQSADDLGAAGWDTSYGSGRVNAAAAVSRATGNVAPPDTTPPAVSIASPASGATVTGSVSVAVSASDNVAVASVSLSVDGAPVGTSTAAPYTFQWATTSVADGAHTLTATASDGAGNSSTSSISVTVNNTTDIVAPTVSITSPADGASATSTVTVYVKASDNVRVVKVELYVDGAQAATSTTAPFTTKWSTRKAAAGAHKLQCKAYDAAGNAGPSQIVTVYK